jgi:hypothetical protein
VTAPHPRLALYIDPATPHFLGDRLFQDDLNLLNGDRQNAPFVDVRDRLGAAGVLVRTADHLPEAVDDTVKLYVSLGSLERFERLAARPDVVLSAFFAMECPIVEPKLYKALPLVARRFRRLFSWSDSRSLRRFTHADLPLRHFRWPQSFDDVHDGIWQNTDRKFLTMINANKLPRLYWRELYTERMRAVEFFARRNEIDLYGKGWDGPSMRVGTTWVPWTLKRRWLAFQRAWQRVRPPARLAAARRAYGGTAVSKAAVLGRYRFALCFENCVLRGWITEKIFDCFFAGTIPIYWGAPEIAEIIPAECFIDMRRYADYADLRRYLTSLSDQDVADYRGRARDFLRSASYHPFSRTAFTEHFVRLVAEDAPSDVADAAASAPPRSRS